MGKMIINEQKMLDFYDRMMERVWLEDMPHGTNLSKHTGEHINPIGSGQEFNIGGNSGDKRVHHQITKYSNGLPRRRG